MTEPLFRSIPGSGIISSRTDWTKNAAHLLAVCGIVTESHQDRAAGEYLLFAGDWLASTAKAFSHSGIRQDAVDHNCLSVDGQRQVQTHDGCKYLAQEDTPLYTHLVMDLAAAYQGQLSAYRRELFWLKPNLLLIRDVFTPASVTAVVTHNLNVLEQPVLDLLGGFTVVAPSGSKLFGVAADWKFQSQQAAMDQNQTTPTYRLTLAGAGAPRYCVGLEIAPKQQAARTVTPFASTALQGMVCGNNLVAAVTLPPPLSYVSPVSGDHWLYGLKPGATYTVNGVQWIASVAGVLHVPGPPVGQPVTIAVGAPPPPPPPPVRGRTFSIFVPNDGGPAVLNEVPPSARPEE